MLNQSPRLELASDQGNDRLLSPPLTAALTILATIAFAISCYLAWIGLTTSKVAGCDGGMFDCSHVMTSRWSQVLGIPVGVPAALLYGAMLVATAGANMLSRQWRLRSVRLILVLSLVAALSALWFTSLQVASVGQLCPYCLVVHACGLVLALLIWTNLRFTKVAAYRLGGISIALVAGLIVTQFLSEGPPTFVIEETTPVSPMENSPVENVDSSIDVFEAPPLDNPEPSTPELFEAPQALHCSPGATLAALRTLNLTASWIGVVMVPQADATATPAEPKMVSIMGNTKQLDASRWPLWGNSSSDRIVVEMFDYTCSHCRNTHRAIKEASNQLGGDFAILALPVPLSRACNDAATSNRPERAGACEIARLAVAVWLIDRSKFTPYHDWLFEQARSTQEARRYAETLVGADELRKQLEKPTASQYIARHVDLYKAVGRGTVPKMIFPTTTVVGEIRSGSTIAKLVREKLK